MARILMEDFDTIDKLKFKGDDIRDWLGVLKELKNTIYISPSDYEKVKNLLQEVRSIIVNNIKKQS